MTAANMRTSQTLASRRGCVRLCTAKGRMPADHLASSHGRAGVSGPPMRL